MTVFRKVPLLASCALVLALPTAAFAENDGSDNRELQRSIYQTLRGDYYYGPAPVEGGYLMQGRASATEPPPEEPRQNEWQRYEQSNTPFEMRPATRPQD